MEDATMMRTWDESAVGDKPILSPAAPKTKSLARDESRVGALARWGTLAARILIGHIFLVSGAMKIIQIQEFLVRDIAETLKERIGAKGVFVRSCAMHLCVHSRGPRDHSMETICTYGVGSLNALERQAALLQLFTARAR
jgi:hypothetical protein